MWSNRKVRWASVLIVLVLLTKWFVSWWAGKEIASPSRRALQDYHREFLGNPAAHGVQMEAFVLADGTPCLIVVPDSSGKLGPRGVKLRQDMASRTVKLPAVGEIVGTLVLIHGRKGRKEDYLPVAERFCAAGFRCLVADLPGHGDHPGAVTRYGVAEAELPGQMVDYAAERYHFDKHLVGLMGVSMGGSVAVQAAAKDTTRWKALVVISSFDSLQPVILNQATGYLGSWLGGMWAADSANRFEERTGVPLLQVHPATQAALLTMPTLIAHGTADRIVPIDCGRRLFAALPAALEKKWVEIPGADHDNVLITDFPVYATVAEWMLKHVSGR